MDEFLEKLLSQVRCKKARPYIRDEIKMHIEDQISDNIRSGMSKEDAEKEAVKDMGDPVEIGISLDRIHKPQISWRMLAIIALISILSIALHYSISLHLKQYDKSAISSQLLGTDGGLGFAVSVLLGLAVMFLLYLIDYTTIGRYSKVIGSVMIIAALYACLFGITVNGRISYIGVRSFRVQLTAFMMFYIPVYGAIVYKYRGGGPGSLLRAVLWMLVPVFLVLQFISIMAAGIMFVCMLVQLTIAVLKGWFKVSAKRTIILIWVAAAVLPIVSILIAEYQGAGLLKLFLATGENSYLTRKIRGLSEDIAFFGSSGKELIGYIPNFNQDYIFTYVLSTYGIFAGLLLIAVLAALIVCIFSTVIKQKNQLGCVMGCGCGMILLMNIIINILESIGAIPYASSFLPFFSKGGSNIILSYALTGIILSIYRYKSVYPQHVPIKLMQKSISISL